MTIDEIKAISIKDYLGSMSIYQQRIIAITGCIKVHSEMNILQVSKLIITKIYDMTLPLMKVGVL